MCVLLFNIWTPMHINLVFPGRYYRLGNMPGHGFTSHDIMATWLWLSMFKVTEQKQLGLRQSLPWLLTILKMISLGFMCSIMGCKSHSLNIGHWLSSFCTATAAYLRS